MKNNEPLVKYSNNTSKTGYPTDKNPEKGVSVIIAVVFALFILPSVLGGAFFLSKGCKGLYDASASKKNIYQCVQGTVIEFKALETRDDDGFTSISYAPVFSYEYKNEEYSYQGNDFTSWDKQDFEIGQKVDIYVSPDNANRIYIPSYNLQNKSTVEFIIFGGFLFFTPLIFGIVIFIKLFRSKRCVKHYNA